MAVMNVEWCDCVLYSNEALVERIMDYWIIFMAEYASIKLLRYLYTYNILCTTYHSFT